jgi:hypothetical protein
VKPTWSPGAAHPDHPNVVASAEENAWGPAKGYIWVGKPEELRVQKWSPRQPHPYKPNVVATDRENEWLPAPGYVWVNPSELTVRIDPILEEIHTKFLLKASARQDGLAELGRAVMVPQHFLPVRDAYAGHPEHREEMIRLLVENVGESAAPHLAAFAAAQIIAEGLRKDFEHVIEKAIPAVIEGLQRLPERLPQGGGGRDVDKSRDINTGGKGSLDLPGRDPSRRVG